MLARPLVQPARRHPPGVLAAEVAFLRTWDRSLIPGMVLVHWIPQGVSLDKRLRILPLVVIGTAKQNADVEVDVHQVGGDQLAVDDDTRGDEHAATPIC